MVVGKVDLKLGHRTGLRPHDDFLTSGFVFSWFYGSQAKDPTFQNHVVSLAEWMAQKKFKLYIYH